MADNPMDDAAKVAGEQLGKLKESASDAAQMAIVRSREAGDQLKRAGIDLMGDFEGAVRKRPITALAAAAFIGLSLGALMKI